MAITQIGSTISAGDPSTGSVTLTKPTGVASGDVLIVVLNCNNQVPDLPSGWTVQTTKQSSTGNTYWSSLAYKVAGGSEPSSYTFLYLDTSGGAPFAGTITAWRGVDTTGTPFGGVNSTAAGNASEAATSGTISNNTATAGRAFYCRFVRNTGTPAPAMSVTSATGGITSLVNTGQASSSGNTKYSHGLFVASSDFTGGGAPAAITATASATETDSIWINWTLKQSIPTNPAPADVASVVSTVNDASASATAPAGAATGAVAAFDATTQTGVAADAGAASVTVSAFDAAVSLIGIPSGVATAYDASVSLQASADVVPVAATPLDAAAGHGPSASLVTASALALDAATNLLATGVGSEMATAYNASVTTSASAQLALVLATANAAAVYYGAPSSRTVSVPVESRVTYVSAAFRTLTVDSEVRVKVVIDGGFAS